MKATLSRAAEGWTVMPVRFSHWSKLPVLLLLGLLVPAGCEDRGAKARQEATDAKATVAKLELRLAGAVQEISDLQVELKAVRRTRDELQEQSDSIRQDREQALVLAQQAKDAITNLTVKADGQASTTASLEKQIAELNAKVQEQKKTIEELQKKASAQPVETETTEEVKDKTPPAEPNEKP
jgi:chromosome segregation ATPase